MQKLIEIGYGEILLAEEFHPVLRKTFFLFVIIFLFIALFFAGKLWGVIASILSLAYLLWNLVLDRSSGSMGLGIREYVWTIEKKGKKIETKNAFEKFIRFLHLNFRIVVPLGFTLLTIIIGLFL